MKLWREIKVFVIVLLLGPLVVIEGGCPPKTATPIRPPPSARDVTDPLARIDLRAEFISKAAPDNPPVVESAKGIRKDVVEADDGVQQLLDAWATAGIAASAKIADLEKKLAAANSRADQRYRAFMLGIKGLCVLVMMAGVFLAVVLPGKHKLTAVAGALAGGTGFVVILVSTAVEDFVYRYGMPIAGGALLVLLGIGAWALVRYIRASHELAAGDVVSGSTQRIVAAVQRRLGVRP